MKVLIIDDEKTALQTSTAILQSLGHRVETAFTEAQARRRLQDEPYDAVFLDYELGDQGNSLELVEFIHGLDPHIPAVVYAATSTVRSAVESMRRGAFDYIQKPLVPKEAAHVLEKVARERDLRAEVEQLSSQLASVNPTINLESNEADVQELYNMAMQAADSRANILLLGESGTGKTVLARNIHEGSPRSGRPFVTIHCPSLSPELLESELFGHVKGSFTGAVKDTWGKVSAADGGTLFLDEIGELPPNIQSKLLRLLQDRAYERIGETRTRTADLRIIAATNADLKEKTDSGEFREDLYFRLNVVSLHLPSLADRPRDILPLARQYVDFYARQMGKSGVRFSGEAEKAILQYPWPGNFRELRNVIERALIFCTDGEIQLRHFPEDFHQDLRSDIRPGFEVTLEELEKEHIQRTLDREKTVSKAASILGIDTATLYRKRKRYGFYQDKKSSEPEAG